MQIPYEPPRKRHLKSPYSLEQETRGSVLRDGSKTSTGSASPIGKSAGGYRPASSGSSAAPTEADTLHSTERDSPQQSKCVKWYLVMLASEFTTILVFFLSFPLADTTTTALAQRNQAMARYRTLNGTKGMEQTRAKMETLKTK